MEAAREARAEDLAAIEAVAHSVEVALEGARGAELFLAREAGPAPFTERLRAALDDVDRIVIVGTYDDVVLGYGICSLEWLADGRRLGVLEDLAVDPEARSSGIGEAMMNEVLRRLTEAGCFGVDSRALPGDRQTKNFFESFGLKARLLVVHRSLTDEDS